MNRTHLFLPVLLLLILPQCGPSKKEAKPKKDSRQNDAVNMPLEKKKDTTTKVSFFSDDVEAFVLEEEPTSIALADAPITMAQANDSDMPEFTWEEPQIDLEEHFEAICFDYDSSSIREDQKDKLVHNLEKAEEIKDQTIVCKGHACKLGKATRMYNVALSEQRAHKVAQAFEDKGLKTKVFGVGYQEADENLPMTKDGQAPNRKVEVYTLAA